jgi:glycosyltransferase involved in cell wall biosynthesis
MKQTISIVVPLLDEVDNVGPLYEEIRELADRDERICEIIFVDDGSTDGTYDRLQQECAGDGRVTVLRLRRNFGQSAALSAGFDRATGEVIVPMDGDRQNDPADIPHLLDKLNEGYDVVSGWRKRRQDTWLTRTLPSMIANALISKITSVRLHDYGCSLKAYRKEVIKGINLYGEMHRFIPSLASWMGVRVAELPVNHRPRTAGKSKYGLGKTIRVILDLINVKFLISYSTRPIQVFGKLGLYAVLVGLLMGLTTVLMKIYPVWKGEDGQWSTVDMTGNPFFLLTFLFIMIGFQFVSIGLLGEINVRTYYESQNKRIYVIRERFEGGTHAEADPS